MLSGRAGVNPVSSGYEVAYLEQWFLLLHYFFTAFTYDDSMKVNWQLYILAYLPLCRSFNCRPRLYQRQGGNFGVVKNSLLCQESNLGLPAHSLLNTYTGYAILSPCENGWFINISIIYLWTLKTKAMCYKCRRNMHNLWGNSKRVVCGGGWKPVCYKICEF